MRTAPLSQRRRTPFLDRKIDRIMVALDRAPERSAALRFAVSLAREVSARVCLAHVVAPESFGIVPPGSMDSIAQVLQAREQQELEQVPASMQDVIEDQITVIGPLEQTMGDLVKAYNINLLVMESSGRQGLRRLLFGSAAEQILRSVTCPVITIGPKAANRLAEPFVVRRVLVATNFDRDSERALRYSTWLTANQQPIVTLLHVLRPADARRFSRTEARLWRLVPRRIAERTMTEFNCIAKIGDPAKLIISAAKKMRADLVVLGARADSWGSLFSSRTKATSAMVIAHAECPVLTMHSKAKRKRNGNS